MTRPSKRELERRLAELRGTDDDPDGPDTLVLEDTVIATGWSKDDETPSDGAGETAWDDEDTAAGEVIETERTEVEL